MCNGEKLKDFLLGSETFATFILHSTRSPSHNRQSKKKKKKEEKKSELSLFADVIMLYKENAKESTKNC